MIDTERKLEAFLKEEVDWHMQYARLCMKMGAELTSPRRHNDWQSRAKAAIRSAESCGEQLRALRMAHPQK